jgi:hypothetical protein
MHHGRIHVHKALQRMKLWRPYHHCCACPATHVIHPLAYDRHLLLLLPGLQLPLPLLRQLLFLALLLLPPLLGSTDAAMLLLRGPRQPSSAAAE